MRVALCVSLFGVVLALSAGAQDSVRTGVDSGVYTGVATGVGGPATTVPVHAGPNVVLVILDDVGKEFFYRYSAPDDIAGAAATPAFETLDDAGVRFNSVYTSPVCGPAKAQLMTGLEEWQSGAYPTASATGNGDQLSLNHVMLPELLCEDNGVPGCGAFGKLGMGCNEASAPWTACGSGTFGQIDKFGWTYYAGQPTSSQTAYGTFTRVTNDGTNGGQVNQTITNGTHVDQTMVDNFIAWQTAQTGQYFAWVHFHLMHATFHSFAAGTPWSVCVDSTPSDAELEACAVAMAEHMDTMFATLYASINLATTYLIVVSDSGVAISQGGGAWQSFNTTHCDGAKFEDNDCGANVAMWMAGPGIAANEVIAGVASMADIYPTVADMMNVTLKTRNDVGRAINYTSQSLLPYAEAGTAVVRSTAYTQIGSYDPDDVASDFYGIRDERRSYAMVYYEDDAPDEEFIYKLPEEKNRISEVADPALKLAKMYTTAHETIEGGFDWCDDDSMVCENFEATLDTSCVVDTDVDSISGSPACNNTTSPLSDYASLVLPTSSDKVTFDGLSSTVAGVGCTSTGRCHVEGLLSSTNYTVVGDVGPIATFFLDGGSTVVCRLQTTSTGGVGNWTVDARGNAATPSHTGSITTGQSYWFTLDYYNAAEGAIAAHTCIAKLYDPSDHSAITGQSSEVASTTPNLIDELTLGGATDTHFDDLVISGREPPPDDSATQDDYVEGLGSNWAANFENQYGVGSYTCTSAGMTSSSGSAAACSSAGIDGLQSYSENGANKYWYKETNGCDTTNNCQVDFLFKMTTIQASATDAIQLVSLYPSGVRGASLAECSLSVQRNVSPKVFRLVSKSGITATDVEMVLSTVYKIRLVSDPVADLCKVWIDPVDGAYGAGELGELSRAWLTKAAPVELTFSAGAVAGNTVWIDNVILSETPTGPQH